MGEVKAPTVDKIEVAPAMIEAGLGRILRYIALEPTEDEMREAVVEIYRAMVVASTKAMTAT